MVVALTKVCDSGAPKSSADWNCLAKFSFNQRTTLSIGPVDVSLLWRWMNKVHLEDLQMASDVAGCTTVPTTDAADAIANGGEGCLIDSAFRTINAYSNFDLTTRFEVTKNLDITMSMFNIFDKKPPVVGGTVGTTSQNGGNTYPSSYDALGRRFAVSAALKF